MLLEESNLNIELMGRPRDIRENLRDVDWNGWSNISHVPFRKHFMNQDWILKWVIRYKRSMRSWTSGDVTWDWEKRGMMMSIIP